MGNQSVHVSLTSTALDERLTLNEPELAVYPVSTLPLVAILVVAQWRAKRAGALEAYRSPFQLLGWKRLLVSLFWQLDVIGIVLIIAVFGLILTPLTLAGGTEDQSRWRDGDILAPLIVGVLCIPAWIIWEVKAPHPMIPFKVSRDRSTLIYQRD